MSTVNEKMYYSISEVCDETGLEQHVLRYWETEFPSLKPKKNRAGNRAYRRKEIELIKYIKYLLYEKQFTIQGAKKILAGQKGGNGEPALEEDFTGDKVKSRIVDIKEALTALKQEIDTLRS